jgi:hypothetical protein
MGNLLLEFSLELELTTAHASVLVPDSESSTMGIRSGSSDGAVSIAHFPLQVLSLAFGAFFKSNWWSIREVEWGFRGNCSGIVSAIVIDEYV